MSRRVWRRGAVAAILAIAALLFAPVPLHGLGIVAVLVLVVLDGPLLAATDGLAFARPRRLDERQVAIRDAAYRRGFRLLAPALLTGGFLAVAGSGIVSIARAAHGGAPSELAAGIGGRDLVALTEVLLMMPTLVLAWSQPDRPRAVGLWPLAVAAAPVQAAAADRGTSVGALTVAHGACRHVTAGRIVGGLRRHGRHARRGLRRRHASVRRRRPERPPGPAAGHAAAGRPVPDRLRRWRRGRLRGAGDVDDFAALAPTTCTAATDAGGTLRCSVRASSRCRWASPRAW